MVQRGQFLQARSRHVHVQNECKEKLTSCGSAVSTPSQKPSESFLARRPARVHAALCMQPLLAPVLAAGHFEALRHVELLDGRREAQRRPPDRSQQQPA
eukprot:4344363-Pleurochrysis_carterae.AAC.1